MGEIAPKHAIPAVIDRTVEKGSRDSSLAGPNDGERGHTGDAQEPKPCRDVESEPAYPSGWEVALNMACILSAIFLMSLVGLIYVWIAPSLQPLVIPRMVDEFHSLNDVGWYGSGYMLTTTCFQLLWGRIYSFYPTKFVFLTVLAFFEIGSAICRASPSSIAFITGRAFAGIGSAGIMSGAIVLMMHAVPLPKRSLYNGFFSVVLGTSSVLGGANIVSVGQNVLEAKLIAGITGIVDNLDRQKIIDAGATLLRDVVPAADMLVVLKKYNLALLWVYIAGTIMAALAALGSFTLEWRGVKDGKGPAPPKKDGAEKRA